MAKWYVWSALHNGGTTKKVKLPQGGERDVVTKRNVVAIGEAVTQKQLDISDEDWKHLIDTGSVRPYPLPEGSNAYTSPIRAALTRATNNRGDIDPRMLLTQVHPVVFEDEPEQGDVPVGV